MKISLNWLKQYLDLPENLDPRELGDKLTMSTVEIDEVILTGEKLKDLYVGRLVKITKHPNADRLFVAEVDIGKPEPVQVVFGLRAEVKEGELVPVVAAPATLPTGIKVEKQKIRGVLSQGMLCLDSEFMVGGQDQLTRFEAEVKPGSLVKDVLGLDDVIYEIDNKSLTNRPDLWGHYGIAREIAAIYHLPLKALPLVKFKEASKVSLKVKVDTPKLCPRYQAVAIGGITVQPSPVWLQNLLKAVGVRPINNLVDLTNYLMLELGQPIHAFDRRQISGDTIIVKTIGHSKFITLDDQERILPENALMINDLKKPVAIAGVMGGLVSEVLEDTTEIILEVANFDAVSIRKTSQSLGLRTEASIRFEKSLDPLMTNVALQRFVNLLSEFAPPSKVISKVIDLNNYDYQERVISLEWDFIKRRIGLELNKKEVISILESLAFSSKDLGNSLEVKPPSFRATKDISLAEDLVEEIARIYGYDRLPERMPQVIMSPPEVNFDRILERKVKNILAPVCGLTEVYNYSFSGQKYLKLLGFKESDQLQLKNYFSEEQKYLRSNMLQGLLKNLEDNLRFYKEFDLFEVGRIFNPGQGEYKTSPKSQEFLAKQEKMVAGLSVAEEVFSTVKGVVTTLLEQLEINFQFQKAIKPLNSFTNPDRVLMIMVEDRVIGWLGELKESLIKNFETNKPVGYWEINFSDLLKYSKDNRKYQPLAKFPGMVIDFSLIVPLTLDWQELKQEVMELSPLIKSVELFDVYRIEKLGPDKKSLAFHVYLSDPKKTLTNEEAGQLQQKIAKNLTKKFKAEVR